MMGITSQSENEESLSEKCHEPDEKIQRIRVVSGEVIGTEWYSNARATEGGTGSLAMGAGEELAQS